MRVVSTAPKNLNSFEETSRRRRFRVEAVRPDDVYYFNNYYYTIYDVNIYIYGRLRSRIIRTYKYNNMKVMTRTRWRQ